MGDVADRIAEEITELSVREIAPGLAQAAIRLAETMDDPSNGATSMANAMQALRAVMLDLRKLAPVQVEGDSVDDITRDREERRARLRAVPAANE